MDIAALFAKLQESPIYHGEILAKALSLKGVPLDGLLPDYPLVKEYRLDSHLFAILARNNIRVSETRGTLTLTDEDAQEPETVGEQPLNAWIFPKGRDPGGDDFRIALHLKPYIDHMKEDGVTIAPISCGQVEQGISHRCNRKMFDILVGNDPDPPRHAIQFTGLSRALFLSWNDLGYEDLKSVFTLFRIATNDKSALGKLAREGIFNPTFEKNEGRGLPYHGPEIQALLIQHWRQQLETFKAQLVI